MSGANASAIARSHQEMSGANASAIARSHQEMSGANASAIARSHQEMSGANASAIARSHLKDDFRLIETMRVSEHGEVQLLDRHLRRLNRSARFFDFKCDLAKVRDDIVRPVPRDGSPACLRLTLARNGESNLESGP